MIIRFYMDMTVEGNEVVDTVKARFRSKESEDYYGNGAQKIHGFGFRQNEEGTYVEYDHFLVGVPTAITAEADLTVRRVEIYEDFPMPWRSSDKDEKPKFSMPKGVYETEGAQAIVDEYQRDSSGYMRIRVVADTIEPAIALFNLIRKGEIEPTELWRDQPLNETDEVKNKQLATTGS